ncbi:hypothetical protein PG993_008701 [Apiospora rasikravindrae]|uniref:Uncharacterized protein n=1 Tax=Apiospora rasikravindrae TaxID=990691 RepID=A0ABR1SP71_9PEZI
MEYRDQKGRLDVDLAKLETEKQEWDTQRGQRRQELEGISANVREQIKYGVTNTVKYILSREAAQAAGEIKLAAEEQNQFVNASIGLVNDIVANSMDEQERRADSSHADMSGLAERFGEYVGRIESATAEMQSARQLEGELRQERELARERQIEVNKAAEHRDTSSDGDQRVQATTGTCDAFFFFSDQPRATIDGIIGRDDGSGIDVEILEAGLEQAAQEFGCGHEAR